MSIPRYLESTYLISLEINRPIAVVPSWSTGNMFMAYAALHRVRYRLMGRALNGNWLWCLDECFLPIEAVEVSDTVEKL